MNHCRLQALFTSIRRLFAHLPLAALVQRSTLILHGGLFRAPPKKGKGSKRRRASGAQQAHPLV
jgi:serine/threonine-protein phosphatase 5